MIKMADSNAPIHELISKRWSPYRFSDRGINAEELVSLFEAARWAPSSYNEQPWRFVVATKDQPQEFEQLVSVLVEANQLWARAASVLVLTTVRTQFERNQKPNAAAEHDLGLAVANLSFEATARGIHVHQMIGVDHGKARAEFQIPEEFKVMTAFALGYAEQAFNADNDYAQRDQTPRNRRPKSEFVFGTHWGKAFELNS